MVQMGKNVQELLRERELNDEARGEANYYAIEDNERDDVMDAISD